ncbi:Gfo/Idh/MocA family protein [Pseudolysinimonas sp.]|uniref:Gfo/Idh/MocA family protein n=1 Tax=Pseudolysinimonas sp. TaxID=2680009 RepID=UPI003F7D6F27
MTGALRVAIVGCGIIGRNHAAAIGRHPDLRIVALVDEIAPAAEALADAVAEQADRPAVLGSLTDALAAEHPDLVVICTPSGMHVDAALEAVAAGAHVLVEKPIDVALDRARRLLAAAEEAAARGQIVSIVSQHRFDPASVVVAEALRSGRFGTATSAVASVAWWRSQDYYDSGAWRGTWALDGGGAVMNQGVHTVDLLLWLLGRPVEVSAFTALTAHERIEVEDVAVAVLRFASGALATFHATTAAYPGLSVRLQVHGSRGSAIIDDDELVFFAAAEQGDEASGSGVENRAAEVDPTAKTGNDPVPAGFAEGHLRQYEDLVDAIRDRRAPGVTVSDAVDALTAVRAIYVSATLGEPVLFDEVRAGRYDDVEVRTGGPAR